MTERTLPDNNPNGSCPYCGKDVWRRCIPPYELDLCSFFRELPKTGTEVSYSIYKDGDPVVSGLVTQQDAISSFADETGLPRTALEEHHDGSLFAVDADGCEWVIEHGNEPERKPSHDMRVNVLERFITPEGDADKICEMDGEPWMDDHILCCTVRFGPERVPVEFMWVGWEAIAAFRYASSSPVALEHAQKYAANWLEIETED